MAADFLALYNIDLQAEMSKAQFGSSHDPTQSQFPSQSQSQSHPSPCILPSLPPPRPISLITGVILPHSSDSHRNDSPTQLYDIHISPTSGLISSITHTSQKSTTHPRNDQRPSSSIIVATQCLALPALYTPHIHIDKAHILSSTHLPPATQNIVEGTFKEALSLTATAKSCFSYEDLLIRGEWVIRESVKAGVVGMRAFVEVDEGVKHLCLRAGLELRKRWESRCEVQICVFAQDPLFTKTGDDPEGGASGEGSSRVAPQQDMSEDAEGRNNRELIEEATKFDGVDVVGSTPYVEGNRQRAQKNVEWIIDVAIRERKHLDLHLDYNLDGNEPALVWCVLQTLVTSRWVDRNPGKTVCLGHCTRMTMFSQTEWAELKKELQGLPISFVGLPNSDLFMMGRPNEGEGWKDRGRGTLQILWMVEELGLNACLGVNNVGNAFTPQGNADPLSVASSGVGIYQAGTKKDAELLYECVSTRAAMAIKGDHFASSLKEGDRANIVLYGLPQENEPPAYRRLRTLQELIYDAGQDRITIRNGHCTSIM